MVSMIHQLVSPPGPPRSLGREVIATACDGGIERSFTRDELLTSVMIFWTTQTINSSIRGYFESGHQESAEDSRIAVPSGFMVFSLELVPSPRRFAERIFSVQRWTEMPAVGHFASMEEPQRLAGEIRAPFLQFR